MTEYSLYQVYCIAEDQFVQVKSFTEPTQCPNIHNDRTIDTNQTTKIWTRPNICVYHLTLTPKSDKVKNKNYQDLKTAFYFNKDVMEKITNIKINSYLESNSGSYTFRAYDETNGLVLGEITLSNQDKAITDIGFLNNVPTTSAIIEFHAKTSDKKVIAHVENIIVHYR